MAKKKKKKNQGNPLSPKPSKIAAGVFFILFSVMMLLSAGTHLSFMGGYLLTFLFGLVGYYGLPLLVILLSLGLFSEKLAKIFRVKFTICYLLSMLAIMMLTTTLVYRGAYKIDHLDQYRVLFEQAKAMPFGFAIDYHLLGGFIGFVLNTFFPESLHFISYLVSAAVLILAIAIMFSSFWRKLFAGIKAKAAIAKSKRPAKQRKPREIIRKEQRRERESRIKLEETEGEESMPSNPLSHLVFEPARRTSIPRRRDRGNIPAPSENPNPAPEQPVAPVAPTQSGPRPLGNTYTGARAVGLQEAIFDPDGTISEVPTYSQPVLQETPKPAPAPTPTPTITPVVQQPQPIVQPEPAPEIFISDDAVEEQPLPSIPEEPAFEALPLETPKPAPMPSPTPTPAPAPVQETPAPKEPEPDPDQEELWPDYKLPPVSLLNEPDNSDNQIEMEQEARQKVEIINQTLADLNIGAHVDSYTIGPSVTRFAIQPDRNVSVSYIGRVVKDIEARIGGLACRYVERVPGLTMPALETMNSKCRLVSLKECINALPPISDKTRMNVAFGVKIDGNVVYANMAEFPHLLLAGTTGSGKSVFVHSLLLALIMRNRPEELKLVLVDPKRVEMTKYRDIPHLLCPIIKEPVHAKNCLRKLVEEMERRYKLFDEAAVQKIDEYNSDYAPYYHKKKLPYIVLVVDEFADLVNNCKEVSEYVLTLGAKARAAGIHMIIATQRPDTKVISGTIKANLPTAVALSVRTAVDSTVILGSGGAEDLAGHGDMLIDCAQISKKDFLRAQGCFVDNREIRQVCDFVRAQQQVRYHPAFMDLDDKEEDIVPTPSNPGEPGAPTPAAPSTNDGEAKYQYIKSIIMTRDFTSISQIQRDFGVGFPRAGKIFNRLQAEGIVDMTPVSASKGCRVLVHEAPASSNPGSTSVSTVEPNYDDDGGN